jgi:hypothetical protein
MSSGVLHCAGVQPRMFLHLASSIHKLCLVVHLCVCLCTLMVKCTHAACDGQQLYAHVLTLSTHACTNSLQFAVVACLVRCLAGDTFNGKTACCKSGMREVFKQLGLGEQCCRVMPFSPASTPFCSVVANLAVCMNFVQCSLCERVGVIVSGQATELTWHKFS